MIPDRLPAFAAATPPAEMAEMLCGAGQPLIDAVAAAWAGSPFLRAAMRRDPASLADFATSGPAPLVARAHAIAADPERAVAPRLRQARGLVALAVALADLGGIWSLAEVVAALSDFADLALDQAIAAAIAERTPGAAPAGFVALALGKLGSRELNYSSDIDLIFLHDRATLPRSVREDPDEAAVRIGGRVVELLQRRDGDGYVARVDLRLRPSPEATPIVLPIEAAIQYYQGEAEAWERAAFIRARAGAGDRALGVAFLSEVQPFVWRRSLDYQAIAEVRAISRRIRDHYDVGRGVGPGFDLKRGRGGIREIEFFAQAHQMIFGGRDPNLRAPATQDALAALATAGRIDAEEAARLAAAYRWLRAAEHRAQMVDDRQTHAVPTDARAAEGYARLAGFADWSAMAAVMASVADAVAPVFDRVAAADARDADAPPRDADALAAWLAGHGLDLDADAVRLVSGWREGSRRALRAAPARDALDRILPALVTAFAAADDPRAALVRFDRFLDQLPGGVGFLALVAANPTLVGLLARMLSAAPVLADALARTPALFDVLIDQAAFAPLPDAAALEVDLIASMRGARGEEERLDRVRRWTGERRFQLGAQLIEGRADPLDTGHAYAALADAAVSLLARDTTAAFEEAHGRIAGGGLIVLAMGRWGGAMLTHRSDLDLVYLHSGAADAVADGPRPTPAAVHFTRLAQRLTAALSVPTAAGALYEVDTRLRPSGAKGPLVAPVEAFRRYQAEEAWTWEHMALTRARIVVGTAAERAEVEAAIAEVLGAPRDPAKLVADALQIRGEMDRHRPGGGPWEVKLGAGGLIDLEFVVHVEQLRSQSALTADLGAATRRLADHGQVDGALVGAHDLMTRVLILSRLVRDATHGTADAPSPIAERLIAAATGHADGAGLRAALARAKAVVAAQWHATFGAAREQA